MISNYQILESIESENIVVLKKDSYSHEVLHRARKKFLKLVEEGIIINSWFNADKWTVCDETANRSLHFNIDKNLYNAKSYESLGLEYRELINMLKSFTIHMFGIIELRGIQRKVSIISSIFENIYEVKVTIEKGDIFLIEEFCEFIRLDEDIVELILDGLEFSKKIIKNTQRTLSNMLSYFIHIEEINNIWKFGSEEEKIYFFPLYFWANVSFIIPLRVTEIIVTPLDCLRPHENKEDEWILTIRRSLKKGFKTYKTLYYRVDMDYEKKDFWISKEIAQNILYYQEKTKSNQRKFLFDYEYGRNSINKMYTSKILRDLLEEFYNKYLKKTSKYNFSLCVARIKEIEKIKLGDSRHVALINLQQQGIPLMRCKELAGHSNINSTAHYASNTANFIECISIIEYERLIKKHRHNTESLFKYLQTQCENIEKELCMSEKRRHDPENIDDCIKAGHLEDCIGCQFRRVGKEIIYREYEEFKEKCNRADLNLLEYIEQYRKIKKSDNSMQELILELQHNSKKFQECCDKKYEREMMQWEERVIIKQQI